MAAMRESRSIMKINVIDVKNPKVTDIVRQLLLPTDPQLKRQKGNDFKSRFKSGRI